MPSRLPEALKTAWDADSMGSTFTGGLWFGGGKKDVPFPYVVLTDLGNAFRFGTTGGESGQAEFRMHGFQANIWYKADGTNDPVLQIGALMRTFDTWVQSHNRTLFKSATEGKIMGVRNLDERIEETDETRVWQGQIDYEARRMKLTNA